MRLELSKQLLFCFFLFLGGCSATKDRRGYEGDLIPLKDVINCFDNYKKATEIILKNPDFIRPMNPYLPDSRTYLKDSLNLRFSYCSINIEDGDTLIVFKPESGADYYMRANKNSLSTYTLFEHSLFYTNQEVDTIKSEYTDIDKEITPYATYHLEGNYYYKITSRMEY